MNIPISDVYTDAVRPPPGNRRINDTLSGCISRERCSRPLLLGFSRVARRNVSDLSMLDDLIAVFGEYEVDNRLRCVLLFAHGERSTARLNPANVGETFRQDWKLPESTVDPWDTFGDRHPGKSLVVAVQGYCYTIGIESMLAVDINLRTSNVHFAQLEMQHEILPFGDVTPRMYQVAGQGNAMRWLLTGNESGAHEVYRLGLVQEVTAPEDLLGHAIALAGRAAAQAPFSVRATLGSAHQTLLEGEAITAAASPEAARRLLDNEDTKEGLRALQECHPGRFEGC